jgi:protein-tyrosine-phosphatase
MEVGSVLFVCYGNIIRSPMAAALLRADQVHRDATHNVWSAGTHAKGGNEADARAGGG